MKNYKVTVTENGIISDLFIEAVSEGEARAIANAIHPSALIINIVTLEDGRDQHIL